jgi:hypothetical protein
MGLVFWSGAATAAMPSGVLTFCLLFGQAKSKRKFDISSMQISFNIFITFKQSPSCNS